MTRLKFLRIDRGWSQHQLAALTAVPQGNVSWIETGRLIPSDTERNTLASVLGIAPERLLDDVSASVRDDPGFEFRDARR